jgi:hypothetical protein
MIESFQKLRQHHKSRRKLLQSGISAGIAIKGQAIQSRMNHFRTLSWRFRSVVDGEEKGVYVGSFVHRRFTQSGQR